MNKYVYLTSEDNNKDSVYVKPDVLKIHQLEELLRSKVVNNLFDQHKDRTEPIGNLFEAEYRENEGSKMREINLMKKMIHCFMNKMVLKTRGTRSTATFITLFNRQVTPNIRKLVSIVQILEKEEDKPYLFYDCERPYVNSLE